MVEKKEGATMTCLNCGTPLTCHEKRYPAKDNYPEKVVMQWQNEDGSAHYSTKDGKNFNCNIPEGQEETTPPANIDLTSVNNKLETIEGILQSVLHIVIDLKSQQNKEESS